MNGRGWRRTRLLLVLVVFLAWAGAGDVYARHVAQRELATRVHERVPEAKSITAKISSLPFVGRLVFQGKVGEVALPPPASRRATS